MEIRLERAMTEGCSALRPCAWCEEGFEPVPVMVTVDPYGYEICPECARAILKGERCGVREKLGWPTWERYQEALRLYREPMMTKEECRRAEELGLYDAAFEMSFLDG